MKLPALGHALGYTALTVILTAGAAQSLAGSNTVASDDIINGQVYGADLANNAVSSAKVYDNSLTGADIRNSAVNGADIGDNSLTGADIDESTLTLPPPTVADGSITNDKLASGSVSADKLLGGTWAFLEPYTVQGATVQVPAGQIGSAAAFCNAGTNTDGIYTGGGYETQPGVEVWAQKGNTAQYGVWVKNNTEQTQPLTAYIQCIHLKPANE